MLRWLAQWLAPIPPAESETLVIPVEGVERPGSHEDAPQLPAFGPVVIQQAKVTPGQAVRIRSVLTTIRAGRVLPARSDLPILRR